MELVKELFSSCFLLKYRQMDDERGSFTKFFDTVDFKSLNLAFAPKECFVSTSHQSVIRGMHFYAPPYLQQKLVTCLSGKFLDVLLDLRPGENYGKVTYLELSFENRYAVFIPPGVAHGFKAVVEHTQVFYLSDQAYNSQFDCGIHFDSFGFDWQEPKPILSARDKQFINFDKYTSPF